MRHASLALSLVLAGCPVAAFAQDGERITSEERASFDDTLEQAGRERYQQYENTPEARAAIENYGKCAAGRQPAEANRLLTMDFTTTRYDNGLRLLSQDAERHCARDSVGSGRTMRSSNLLFAGAVAEALIEADATPVNVRLARAAAGKAAETFAPSDAAAMCVAKSAPDDVAKLFATELDSEAEMAATNALSPVLAACARLVGSPPVEATPFGLRSIVATAAYRLLAAQESGA